MPAFETCLLLLSFNMTWKQLKLITPAMQGFLCNFLLCANTTGLRVVSRSWYFSPNYGEIVKLRLKTSTLQSCMHQSCTEVIWKVFPGAVGLYLLVVFNTSLIGFFCLQGAFDACLAEVTAYIWALRNELCVHRSKPQNKKYFIRFSESTLENSCVYRWGMNLLKQKEDAGLSEWD